MICIVCHHNLNLLNRLTLSVHDGNIGFCVITWMSHLNAHQTLEGGWQQATLNEERP